MRARNKRMMIRTRKTVTPMKLKMMGDVFEGLLVVRGSPITTDTLHGCWCDSNW